MKKIIRLSLLFSIALTSSYGQRPTSDPKHENHYDDITFTTIFTIPGKIADMQFNVLSINRNDTFKESGMTPINTKSADFVLDPYVTILKNK